MIRLPYNSTTYYRARIIIRKNNPSLKVINNFIKKKHANIS